MKKLLVLFFIAISLNASAKDKELRTKWEQVINAISWVESGRKNDAVSPCGRYVGYLQISKCMVRQCNIIAGYEKYTYNDRYSIEKSIAMFIDFQEHFNSNGGVERAIRLWNSGDMKCMQQERKPKTERYYRKVIKEYNLLAKK